LQNRNPSAGKKGPSFPRLKARSKRKKLRKDSLKRSQQHHGIQTLVKNEKTHRPMEKKKHYKLERTEKEQGNTSQRGQTGTKFEKKKGKSKKKYPPKEKKKIQISRRINEGERRFERHKDRQGNRQANTASPKRRKNAPRRNKKKPPPKKEGKREKPGGKVRPQVKKKNLGQGKKKNKNSSPKTSLYSAIGDERKAPGIEVFALWSVHGCERSPLFAKKLNQEKGVPYWEKIFTIVRKSPQSERRSKEGYAKVSKETG